MICFGYSEGDSTQVSANIPSLNNLCGQKSIKFLGGILENFQTSKGHSEIDRPLGNEKLAVYMQFFFIRK